MSEKKYIDVTNYQDCKIVLHNEDEGIRIKDIPAADVQEVIRCKDCVYWKDRHIVQNDGVQRQYKTNEGYVPLSVGFNVGSTCGLEDENKRAFRNENDFCSRGVKRPTSYEKWWGIVDGFYPSDYDAEMFETEGEK